MRRIVIVLSILTIGCKKEEPKSCDCGVIVSQSQYIDDNTPLWYGVENHCSGVIWYFEGEYYNPDNLISEEYCAGHEW